MSAQKLIVAQLLLLFILSNINGVLSIKRSSNHSLSNQTDSTFKDRDGRQYGMSGYGPGFPDFGLGSFGGPIEAIIIGLLVVLGFGIVGIPFFLLILAFFGGGGLGGAGGIGGLNLVPTSTTTVAGRKRRDINSLFPEVNPLLRRKLLNVFENFIQTPDKIKVIEKFFDSMVGRN